MDSDDLVDLSEGEEALVEAPPYPYCTKCRYIATNYASDWKRFKCFAPANVRLRRKNPVDGGDEVLLLFEFCSTARTCEEGCGLQARWFEERPVIPKPADVVHPGNRERKDDLVGVNVDALLKRLKQEPSNES